MSRPFVNIYKWWFAGPMIKTFLGAIMNIVVYIIHSMISIHLSFVQNVLTLSDSQLHILVAWQQVHVWLGKLILVDVASMGSQAYRLWWMWTNIVCHLVCYNGHMIWHHNLKISL